MGWRGETVGGPDNKDGRKQCRKKEGRGVGWRGETDRGEWGGVAGERQTEGSGESSKK